MKTLGRHLIAELYGCDRDLLVDLATIERAMHAAASAVGATVLGASFHTFEPDGVSGALVIAESHLSIHTWPRHGYVALDVYTCGGLDPRPACDHLAEVLGSSRMRLQEILRGVPEELAGHGELGPDDVEVATRWVEVATAAG